MDEIEAAAAIRRARVDAVRMCADTLEEFAALSPAPFISGRDALTVVAKQLRSAADHVEQNEH